MQEPLKVWVISDPHHPGSDSQGIGIAQKLSADVDVIPYNHFTAFSLDETLAQHMGNIDYRSGNGWPDVIIGTRDETRPAELLLKRKAREKIFSVHLGDPREDGKEFDLTVCSAMPPARDSLSRHAGGKILFTTGVAHKVTSRLITEGKKQWHDQFSGFQHPIIGVLVGGNTGVGTGFNKQEARQLAHALNKLAHDTGGSLVITNSMRTSDEATQELMKDITAHAYFHDVRRSGENPYFGLLGLADAFVVTGESMSMCCEALSTGKPVYIYPMPTVDLPTHLWLQDELVHSGRARMFDGKLESWTYPPLDTAAEVAQEIRKQLAAQKSVNLF